MPKFSKRLRKEYHEKNKFSEFGSGKEDVVICPEGNEVYYYKSWHHSFRNYPHLTEEKRISFKLCPYHWMKKNRLWEGEVVISGTPKSEKAQILETAQNVSDEAHRRDPMDKILDIKHSGEKIHIYTSENQLARKIARKIAESFKKHLSRPKINKGKGADYVLITMEWQGG